MKKYYIEVDLKSEFNIITETLTRIGILNNNTKELYQSCHIFHNKGKYFIVHFKELFSMFSFKNENNIDESKIHMNEDDFNRRNSIIFLLQNWGLINIQDNEYITENKGNVNITVIPFKEKDNYKLISKFSFDRK